MPLSAGMQTALDGTPSALVFLALEVLLPSGPLRLLDGAGELTLFGHAFSGGDPDRGVIQSIQPSSDGIGADAPSLTVVMNPPSNAASADLAGAATQGSAVTVWIGVLNPADMTLIGEPYELFAGELDQGVLRVNQGSRTVTLECVSVFERFFDDDEGIRLTDAWHQSIYPGETGLEFVTEIQRQLPWGIDTPTPAAVSPTQAAAAQAANALARSLF